MNHLRFFNITLLTVGVLASAWSGAQDLKGADVYGDWKTDKPGLTRWITAADVKKPLPAGVASDANRSKVIPKPDYASIQSMPDFEVKPWATNLVGARSIKTAPNGDIFVTLSRPPAPELGSVVVLRPNADGSAPATPSVFADKLKDAYGIAFHPPGPNPQWLYVGMEGKVVRFPYKNGDLKAGGDAQPVVQTLPIGSHWTRDVAFSPDGKTMYLAVGSGSNVAIDMLGKPNDIAAWEKAHGLGAGWGMETDRATVMAYDSDGSNRRVFATGIRNCSGLTVHAGTGSVFCSTNERDLMGDDTPPDYITSVSEGRFYGWPWYYIGDNEDTRPGGGRRPDLKGRVTIPDVLVQPHSAPLGMAFNNGNMFPAEMKGDGFAALHGSWNRKFRTGYKIVRLPQLGGVLMGNYQDFVMGFTDPKNEENVWGRPVNVEFMNDGSMLFSDDGNHILYRVTYKKP